MTIRLNSILGWKEVQMKIISRMNDVEINKDLLDRKYLHILLIGDHNIS